MTATERTDCRACQGTEFSTVLDLGWQPLANRFLTQEQLDEPEPAYRLHLVRCLTCGLVQLTHVVDPAVLYGPTYPYRSGFSEGWRKHCGALANEIAASHPHGSVMDIGCLDGVLLGELAKAGCQGRGCDPSGVGPFIERELFGKDTRFPSRFDVIVAQNVFGHVDDAKGFLEGVAANLAPDGVCIIEVPWVVPMIREGRWDTVYHEHLSYWSQHALNLLANSIGLWLIDQRHFPDLHGGTLRFYLRHTATTIEADLDAASRITKVFFAERNTTPDDYQRFAIRAYGDIKRWAHYFANLHGKTVAAYGASAKLSTFLNALPERPHLMGVFDDNLAKWNRYTPGYHYPVLIPTKMTMQETDVLIVPGNWKDEIESKARDLGFAGEIKSLW